MNQFKNFSIISPSNVSNKVPAIKAMRALTGLGLKEAKDAVDAHPDLKQTFEIPDYIVNAYPNPVAMIEEQFNILKLSGITVCDPMFMLLNNMRQLASEALLIGEDEFASEILQLVLAEKLRRSK